MIALYVAAASVVAVAVALLLARPPVKLRTADQRGITLQTLIVTAVLVLMAGAAGVVIIAITNNAQDNLEGQNTGVESRCEPWEIFDPTLDAAGRGGGNGGIDSSASGCVRVCYVKYNVTTAVKSSAIADNAIDLIEFPSGATSSTPANGKAYLLFSRSSSIMDIDETSGGANEHTLPVNGDRSVDANGNVDDEDTKDIKINNETNQNLSIELAPNQRYCRVWNNTDDKEEFRSRN